MADVARSANPPSPGEGIRERKKRQTRGLISDTATRMFLAGGFDSVKVADIARECDVAEKTVYNYFPTKESLLLDREAEMVDAITAAFGPGAASPPIAAALDVLATQRVGMLASLPPGPRGLRALRAFIDLLESTPSLRAARRDLDARLVRAAAAAMAGRAGLDPDEPEVQIAAETILGLWRVQFAALRRHTAAGVSVDDGLEQMVSTDVVRAARLIDSGLWTFGTAVSAPGDRQQLEAAEVAAGRSARQVSAMLRKIRRDRRNRQLAAQ
jgi:AcrR family transcriptional regulator